MKFRFAMLAGGWLIVMATAQASAQLRTAFGVGAAYSCGAWTQARQNKSVSARLAAQWIAGWLSALNASGGPDFLAASDYDGLMARIDNYCRTNPLDTIGTAAAHLTNELRSRVR